MKFKGRIQSTISLNGGLYIHEANRDFDDLQDIDRICQEMQDEIGEKIRVLMDLPPESSFPVDAFEAMASSFWKVDTD